MSSLIQFLRVFALSLVLVACQGVPELVVDRYQYDDISDDDFDGVINARDICTQTPASVAVDQYGCTSWLVEEAIEAVNIMFEFDEFVVPAVAEAQLSDLADLIRSHPDYRVTVIGDTSPEGTLAYNTELAHKRAQAIVDMLLWYSVPKDKIDVHYFTENIPLVKDYLLIREHRAIALIHSPKYENVPEWNIFTSELELQAREEERKQ